MMRKEFFTSKRSLLILLGLVSAAALIVMPLGCGGGSSGTSTTTYTVGGNIAGLTGDGLVLQNNAGDDLTVAASDTTFTFNTPLADGAGYNVQVSSQPASQLCTTSTNSGTIPSANVTNIDVTCSAATYTVGGNVTGLTGSPVVLQNNAGDDLTLHASDTTFTFTTPLADGAGYDVQVSSQFAGQTCIASSNSGTISGANVTNVDVTCTQDVTLSGDVFDPMAGTPVGGATVTAYRFDDSTLISSTTSASGAGTGSFTVTGIPQNVEIYLKASKTGYVSGNTRTGTLTADDTGVEVNILPDSSAELVGIANALSGESESSWNSTLKSYGYLVMDAEDTNTDDLGGVTVIASPSLPIYYDTVISSAEAYTTTAPTSSTIALGTSSSERNMPMMKATVANGGTFGPYSLTGSLSSGTLEETAINAPIIQGEITYFEWYEQ